MIDPAMGGAAEQLELRQSENLISWNRAILRGASVFLAVWMIAVAVQGWLPGLIGGPVMAVMLTVYWRLNRRLERVMIIARGDTLVVRNMFGLHEVAAADIVTVRYRRSFNRSTGPDLEIHLRDGHSIWSDLAVKGARSASGAISPSPVDEINRWLADVRLRATLRND